MTVRLLLAGVICMCAGASVVLYGQWRASYGLFASGRPQSLRFDPAILGLDPLLVIGGGFIVVGVAFTVCAVAGWARRRAAAKRAGA